MPQKPLFSQRNTRTIKKSDIKDFKRRKIRALATIKKDRRQAEAFTTEMSKTRIPIFFATDDNYFKYLTVALASIEKHASDEYIYDIKILATGLSEENKIAAANLGFSHLAISIVDVEAKMERIRTNVTKRLRDYYSESIFYRIFIPHLFPRLEKAVYLDCDVVLNDDVAKLYFTDIGDKILGAVADESIAHVPAFCEYVDKVIGSPEGVYFNSGVLLINAKKFREEKIEEKLLYLICEYNFHTVAPDQDYLNFLCKDKIHYFDIGWNKQPCERVNFDEKEIHLIHFNMFTKPWHYSGVKYESYFWEAAKSTPYYEELLDIRESYGKEDRARDIRGAKRLIATSAGIARDKCSFCHVISSDIFDKIGCEVLV